MESTSVADSEGVKSPNRMLQRDAAQVSKPLSETQVLAEVQIDRTARRNKSRAEKGLMGEQIKELPEDVKKLARLALFYSLIDEAESKVVKRIKIYGDLERRSDVALGAELFKKELLKAIRAEIRR